MKILVAISFKTKNDGTNIQNNKIESKTSETTNIFAIKKTDIFFQFYKIPFKLFLSKFKLFCNLQFHAGGKIGRNYAFIIQLDIILNQKNKN